MQNHGPQSPSGAPREVVLPDAGGWISGPMLDPGMLGWVPASEVRAGDRLAHDGRVLTVTAAEAAWYVEDGQHVAGLAIACRDGSARWTLYRRGSELLDRVRTGGAA